MGRRDQQRGGRRKKGGRDWKSENRFQSSNLQEELAKAREQMIAEQKARRAAAKAQRKAQTRGATPSSGFDEKTGRIKIGTRWVDPQPVQGQPLEVRPRGRARWFSPSKRRSA